MITENKNAPASAKAGPRVDVRAVEAMGKELVASMQTVRELLEARTDALETCRAALEAHHQKMVADGKALGELETQTCGEIENRLAEVSKREEACGRREKELHAAVKAKDETTQQVLKHKTDVENQEKDIADREHTVLSMSEELKADRQKLEDDRTRFEESTHQLTADSTKFLQDRAHWESRHAEINAQEMKLAQTRKTLDDDMQKFVSDRENMARDRKAQATREQELSALSGALEKRKLDIERRESSAGEYERQWDEKLRELNIARDALSSLQRQLESELTKVVGQRDDLLPRFGVSETDVKQGAPANKDVPTPPADQEARASLERFQKLCRDAKRRAIGAG